jgi:hypothetical protein
MRLKIKSAENDKTVAIGDGLLQHLIIYAWHILHHFFHRAVENTAKVIDGGGVQRLVVSQFVQGGTGNAMIFN